jgi:hypothetical protein
MPDAFLSRPQGYQQITDLSAAVGLTVPHPDTAYAIITVEGQNVRWRDDGQLPTATVGQLMRPGDSLRYDGPLTAIRFIGAGATLNASYYT